MKVFDIAIKDLTQSFRSVFMVGMTIIAPLALTGLMYMAFGGMQGESPDLPKLVLGVVNHDQPVNDQEPLGELMVGMFTDSSVSSWLEVSQYSDEASARADIDDQKIGALVVFPENLTQATTTGEGSAQVVIIKDPTISVTPAVVRNMIVSFLDGVYSGRVAYEVIETNAATAGFTPDPASLQTAFKGFSQWYIEFQRSLFHSPDAVLAIRSPETSPEAPENAIQRILAFTLIGQIIFFAFFTAAFAMQSILNEDEQGTLQRLFTTPTARMNIITGKFVFVVLTVTLQSFILLLLGRIIFGVEWKPLGNTVIAVIAQVIAASGLGVLLIALVKNSRQAGPVLGGGLTFLGMLGGLFTATISMPAGFALINKFTPQGWVMETWRTAVSAASLSELIVPAIVSVAFGAVSFTIGAILFRRRYA